MTKNKTKPKSRPFKMLYVGKEWDTIFLLPPPAFKLWVFYYRLEGPKREGWATREHISDKCGMSPDVVTDWRKYLVKHGWMRQVGEHKTPNNPLATTPIMQVCRGTIPTTVERRGKSAGSRAKQFKRARKLSVTAGTENLPHRAVTENQRSTVRQFSSGAVTETFRDDVDVSQKLDKTYVDGKRPEELISSRESQVKLPVGFEWRDGKAVQTGGAR